MTKKKGLENYLNKLSEYCEPDRKTNWKRFGKDFLKTSILFFLSYNLNEFGEAHIDDKLLFYFGEGSSWLVGFFGYYYSIKIFINAVTGKYFDKV